MSHPIIDYLETCIGQLAALRAGSFAALAAASEAVAGAIQADKGYFLYGSGHSALIAREAFWRAGGLAPAIPIEDPAEGDAERVPGYVVGLLAHYDLQPGSVVIIVSNSGINHAPIEAALECKARGATVIALTCLAHSRQSASRHPTGKRLFDIADIVVDTQGIPGDAVVSLPGLPGRVGPTSTVVDAAIIDAITVGAAARLLERGLEAPVLVSSNLPEGDAHNARLVDRYRDRLVRRLIPTADARPAGR